MSSLASHPDSGQLAAFAQRLLPEPDRGFVLAHLEVCWDCRQKLVRLPSGTDSLNDKETSPPATEAELPFATLASDGPHIFFPADLAAQSRYEILHLIGQGGMGAVFKARHLKMDRLVAIKVIKPQLIANEQAVERFRREVKAAAQLHHPNVVTAWDADQVGNTHFLVMEFIEGTDLANHIRCNQAMTVRGACDCIRQAALGLQHAHECGMVHRDIKPHNLMLTPDGVVKVMDFGLARLEREPASQTGTTGDNILMGTADYIAPEQAQDGHRADIRADIYGLGCTLFHLLAGKPPFAGISVPQKIVAHATAAIPFAELPRAVPTELRAVIAKALAKVPEERFQTPAQFAEALKPFVSSSEGKTPLVPLASEAEPVNKDDRTPLLEDKRRRRGKRWRAWGACALTALIVVGAIAYFANNGRQPKIDQEPAAENPAPAALPPTFTNGLGMEFVLVRRGRFPMGGGAGKLGETWVEIADDFFIGKFEVTQSEWLAVTGANNSSFSRLGSGKELVEQLPDEELQMLPAESMTWAEAQQFVELLNKREPHPAWTYRLPKAAEWEYACRGGPTCEMNDYAFDFYFAKPTNEMSPEQANFAPEPEMGLRRTRKVGSYEPNRLGLFDMHGNVWEWSDDTEKDANGALQFVFMGGCWGDPPLGCRASVRSKLPPSVRHNFLGLRLVRVPVAKKGDGPGEAAK